MVRDSAPVWYPAPIRLPIAQAQIFSKSHRIRPRVEGMELLN